MKTAKIELEVAELLALMWAVEQATEQPPSFAGRFEDELRAIHKELSSDAYAVHQRLQAAWLEIK